MQVKVGQFWRRPKTGVVYEVVNIDGDGMAMLKPAKVPEGVKARRTWKWVSAILYEMESVDGPASSD